MQEAVEDEQDRDGSGLPERIIPAHGLWVRGSLPTCSLTAHPDLVRMIHENGQEGVKLYVQQVTEGVMQGVTSGEIEIPEPLSEGSLKAVGISCGMALHDALDHEAR